MSGRVTRATANNGSNADDTKPSAPPKESKRNGKSGSKAEPVASGKLNGANGSAPSTAPNSSRKRAHRTIKEEDQSEEEKYDPKSAAIPLHKRVKTESKSAATSKKKPSKTKPAAKPKLEPDFEAGAKLASSMLAPASQNSSPSKPKINPYNLSPGISPYPNYLHPTPAACRDVHDRLAKIHGSRAAPKTIPAPNLQSSGCGEVPSVLDALVRTRLSANTNNANSNRAFRGVVTRFGILDEGVGKGSVDWENVRRSDVGELFEAIKSGGLAAVKSKDIKAILELVYAENQEQAKARGEDGSSIVLSLDHLHAMSSEDAFAKLLGYPGVGPKTASCVLLFCMQRPSFAVDTHVFRITRWLGWTPSDAEVKRMGKDAKTDQSPMKHTEAGSGNSKSRPPPPVSRNTTYAHLDVRIPDDLKYPLHYLLIKHGKTCPSCMAKRDGKVKEAWGGKQCPIKDLKTGLRSNVTKDLEKDIIDDEDSDEDLDADDSVDEDEED